MRASDGLGVANVFPPPGWANTAESSKSRPVDAAPGVGANSGYSVRAD